MTAIKAGGIIFFVQIDKENQSKMESYGGIGTNKIQKHGGMR